ncbi:VCBS repeat-containing protein, partial [bacterium]|nr:VCBS repeat-containing protein [bacterium]
NSPKAESASLLEVEGDEFINRIRELLFLDVEVPEAAIKLKLFGISGDGDLIRTKQRLTARGTRNGNEFRSSAVVDATWITVSNDEPPLLREFALTNLVQSELTSAPTSAFEDIAGTVLGGNPSWGQLRLGMNTWGRHIEHSLNPDFLGYHGVAVGDVDGDGLEDLYLCQPGGLPNLLFRQQVDGTLVDVSASSGVDWLDNSTGALLIDLDNDGDADLAVATQSSFLVMENDGTGRFSIRRQFSGLGPGFSPTAADFDLDGDLDLFVLRYAASGNEIGDFPTPHPFHDARNGGANVLLRNEGGFQFADVTKESGLGENNHRFSFAASWDDVNNDGTLDLYVANDFGPNQLFRNDGAEFVDVSLESGSQDWGFGMSATWGDYDRDGFMDLYVSSMFSSAGNQIVAQSGFNPTMREETRQKFLKMVRGNSLLRNNKGARFSDITQPMNEGFGGWAWGSRFADLNNDGWEYLCCQRVYFPTG